MFWVLRMFGLSRRPPETAPAVFDRGYLTRLGSHVGEDALRELVADGLFELTDRLRRAQDCAGRGELEAMGALAHDIASVAGHLGLSELSRLAVDINRAAREEPGCDAREIARPLAEAGPVALETLRAFLDETMQAQQNRA